MHTAFIYWYQFSARRITSSFVLLTAASPWAAVPGHWWTSEWVTPSQTQEKTLEIVVTKMLEFLVGSGPTFYGRTEAPTKSGWTGFPTCGHMCFKENCFKAVDSKWVAIFHLPCHWCFSLCRPRAQGLSLAERVPKTEVDGISCHACIMRWPLWFSFYFLLFYFFRTGKKAHFGTLW